MEWIKEMRNLSSFMLKAVDLSILELQKVCVLSPCWSVLEALAYRCLHALMRSESLGFASAWEKSGSASRSEKIFSLHDAVNSGWHCEGRDLTLKYFRTVVNLTILSKQCVLWWTRVAGYERKRELSSQAWPIWWLNCKWIISCLNYLE